LAEGGEGVEEVFWALFGVAAFEGRGEVGEIGEEGLEASFEELKAHPSLCAPLTAFESSSKRHSFGFSFRSELSLEVIGIPLVTIQVRQCRRVFFLGSKGI